MVKKASIQGIQKIRDTRGVLIDQVGITNLEYTIPFIPRNGEFLNTVAMISMRTFHEILHDLKKGHVTMRVLIWKKKQAGWDLVWNEKLPAIVEQGGSASVYNLAKWSNVRCFTMQAFDNPVFVEDLVRYVVREVHKDKRIMAFEVEAVNQEGIHAHDVSERVFCI